MSKSSKSSRNFIVSTSKEAVHPRVIEQLKNLFQLQLLSITLESKSKIEIKFTSKLRLITHHISTFKIPHYQLLQHYQHIEKLCVHVSNLSKRVTDAELKETFEKYGQIEYASVCMEPRSKGYPGKVSRGFGFVKFAKKESVQIAIEAMQDKELHGSKMKVEVSKRAEPRRKTPGRYAGYAYRRSRSRSHRRRRSVSSDSYSSSRRRHHSRRRHYKRRSISKSPSRSPSQSHRRRRR